MVNSFLRKVLSLTDRAAAVNFSLGIVITLEGATLALLHSSAQ
jgi:hypothetical protein